jgi:hypothetical protein
MTSTHPGQSTGVDVAAKASRLPYVALTLGILSVPGSIMTWDTSLPGEGYVWGLPVGLLAVVLGIVALRARSGARWASITGVVLGGAMVAMVVVWTLAEGG